MSSAKIQVIVIDHGDENVRTVSLGGLLREGFRYSGFLVGNPGVKANGISRQDVVNKIVGILLEGLSAGRPHEVVEVDLMDHRIVQEVMES